MRLLNRMLGTSLVSTDCGALSHRHKLRSHQIVSSKLWGNFQEEKLNLLSSWLATLLSVVFTLLRLSETYSMSHGLQRQCFQAILELFNFHNGFITQNTTTVKPPHFLMQVNCHVALNSSRENASLDLEGFATS